MTAQMTTILFEGSKLTVLYLQASQQLAAAVFLFLSVVYNALPKKPRQHLVAAGQHLVAAVLP